MITRLLFLSAVPPLDHLAIFDWLLQRAGPDEPDPLTHAYIRSALLEAAGRRDEALAGYCTISITLTAIAAPALLRTPPVTQSSDSMRRDRIPKATHLPNLRGAFRNWSRA